MIPVSNSDPYELERLAEELEAREVSGKSSCSDGLELPVYVPLSHDNEYLSAETFNVEKFLLSRAYTSLPELRTELKDYLSSLKEELVRLINDDYEDFISLSTDLSGEKSRLERIKAPLSNLRQRVLIARESLQDIQDTVQVKLEARAKLRDEKVLLHLLLKISESLSRLESLLLLQSEDTSDHAEILTNHLAEAAGHGSTVKTQGSRGKHLSRVAMEYMQLLYHISKARSEKCAYVDAIQERVDRVRSTLTSDLDHLFSATLLSVTGTDNGKIQGIERSKAVSELTECLRVYDNLGLWRAAEEIIRRAVIQPFIRKTVFQDALAVPISPIVPRTPVPPTAHVPTSAHVPHTPFTPYTALLSMHNSSNGFPSAISFLDGYDDPLSKLYNQILRFIERDLSHIMEIAERLSSKVSTRSVESSGNELGDRSTDGFDLMANVIWPEFGLAIMNELGSVVFAAGKPDEFVRRHASTQAFIHALEFLAPSRQSVHAMRSHPVFVTFNRRWQLPVYFQLRWKEIIGGVEDSLNAAITQSESVTLEPGRPMFLTAQAEVVWASITSCWSPDIFIPDLAPRFWKLTLQLLSRYKTWLDASLPSTESSSKLPAADKSVHEISSENSLTDDLHLKQFATILVDINAMNVQVLTLWRERISATLPEPMVKDMCVPPEEVLRQQLGWLGEVSSLLTNRVVVILSRRACDALLPVRSIPSQFRAMSSKRTPTEPSYFIMQVLRPVRAFFGIGTPNSAGERLREAFLDHVAKEVFDYVCQRYIQYLTAMRKTEESLRRLKKGKKTTFGIFQSSSSTKDEDRDEERIAAQMMLDVDALGQDAQALSRGLRGIESYVQLVQMVQTDFGDES
ncbi:oligomeric golgi complex component, COG2-domain-containing protein [Pisolithus croceorrhizus]|nr:oligomeric golgi complex component, COG2-domain-containing protein [Pisolithus croceorrhizus]